ncbi:MAG: hypothetical protein K6T27_05045 [Thermoleophilum sp.]|nr:hypothetical protein [Thermoleophilum sp.]
MAISRPLLLALIAAVLAAATYAVSIGNNSDESAGTAAPPPVAQRPNENAAQGANPAQRSAAGKRVAGSQRAARDSKRATSPTEARNAAGRERSGADTRQRAVTKTRSAPRSSVPRSSSLPAAFLRSLERGRTVVLFFYDPRGIEDSDVAAAVRAVERSRLAPVVRARSTRIDDYAQVLGKIEINQVPAVVIVGRDRKARVVEGYIDPETLVQEVRDSRR